MANFALIAEDEELKDELYGEAIVMVGESSGANQVMTVGALAGALVVDGKVEVAKQLVADTWEDAKDLREQLDAGEAKTKIGESRTFVPALGLVDARTALDLLKLTGREVEMPGLVGQCLAFASISGDQDLEAICKEKGVTFDATGFSRSRTLMAVEQSRASYTVLSEWIQKHADIMPDSLGKVEAAMLAARHLPESPERAKLIKMAATARKACSPTYFWDDPAKEILEELPKFESMTISEFDQLLFAAIEHAPTKISSFQLNGVFANLVKMIAVRDPEVAREILEPAFENGAWRYGDPQWSAFENNMLLKAFVWIDPELAGDKALELSDHYAGDAPVRRLQLLTSVIDELNIVAIRKGMLSKQ